MKKILIILTSALTISLIFIIIFLYKLDKREAEIINLKNRIEQDSLSYNNTTANDKWAYKFMSAGVRVIPEKDKIQIGDSLRLQVFLSAYDMIKDGKMNVKPILLLGNDIDTNNIELIGHIDTIRQNGWNPIITKKTNKLGKDSIIGIYCIPNPVKDKLTKFYFKFYYTVIERERK